MLNKDDIKSRKMSKERKISKSPKIVSLAESYSSREEFQAKNPLPVVSTEMFPIFQTLQEILKELKKQTEMMEKNGL